MKQQDKNNNFFLQQGKMTEKARILKIIDNISTNCASLDWCYKEQLKKEIN